MNRREALAGAALAALIGIATGSRALGPRRLPERGRPDTRAPPAALRPDINHAPERLLLLLPRIGPSRARAIVEERARAGPYRDLADLARVRGIGAKTVARLMPLARARPLRGAAP